MNYYKQLKIIYIYFLFLIIFIIIINFKNNNLYALYIRCNQNIKKLPGVKVLSARLERVE
jgi:hypothetical protein